MILIPEIQTVMILVPRTGTGTLRRAIAARYPQSIALYRHMEADGVPHGYDRWQKVGVVRDPVDRLWSLWKFLQTFGGDYDGAFIRAMRESVRRPFCEWVVENEVVFTSPYDRAGLGRFFPGYTVRHPLPENRKSQMVYLRPDLGTNIYRFEQMDELYQRLDIDVIGPLHNVTESRPVPDLTPGALDYVRRWFSWDLAVTGSRYCAHQQDLAA